MAKKFLSAIQLLTVNTDPVSASAGDIYFNANSNSVKYYDGTNWKSVPKNLSDLGDISASGVTDGQTLVYDGTLSKWENASVPPSVVPSGSTLPESSTNGLFFYNTSDQQLYFFFNQWISISFTPFDLDGGTSSTTEFELTVDGGDSSTITFAAAYDGGNSSG
jgi:hypothetical protein